MGHYVLQTGGKLFTTEGSAINGYDALKIHNMFCKIERRELDIAEKVKK